VAAVGGLATLRKGASTRHGRCRVKEKSKVDAGRFELKVRGGYRRRLEVSEDKTKSWRSLE